MPNEKLWNFLTGSTLSNGLFVMFLISAGLLMLALWADFGSKAYQNWSKQQSDLHSKWMYYEERSQTAEADAIQRQLQQQKYPKAVPVRWSLVYMLAAVGMIAFAGICLTDYASGHFSKNFAIDSYNPKYAVKQTEPIKSYVLTKDNDDTNDTQTQVYTIGNADHVTVTTADQHTYKLDSDQSDQFSQINVTTKPTKRMPRRYSMTLTTITPKKQYRHYNGARTAKILDVTQYAKIQKTNN